MKKVFSAASAVIFCLSILFTGCANSVDSGSSPTETTQGDNSKPNGGNETPQGESDDDTPVNGDYGLSRAANLDWIFNNKTLGKTTVKIKRSEWKTLCDDYRYFFKNENCVHAESYTYEKDGHKWVLTEGIGFRLRGNTSRYCPQGIDNGNLQGQMNADWNSGYYTYANQPNNDYRQTHFKIDFEEFLGTDEDGKDKEQKMAGCMKGVALKRMDESCTREIFCYDLFHKNGIWTAPRASHTRLILKIVEDETDNSVTTIDYGVYEMFEEVNKQSLKARDAENNQSSNAWKNNKGNLWKCSSSLTTDHMTDSDIGVEDIRIIKQGDEIPEGMETNTREDSIRIGYIKKGYSLDLKTNKDDLGGASSQIRDFITELNALPMATSESDTNAISTIKAFYEKWFDVDFFLKTYAINILCGMDDDYWANSNNYYLYFDTGKKGSGKLYFIPFDYDNTLGHSINGDKDGSRHDPMDWGRSKDSPLMDRLLSVPEYKEKFKEILLEVCQNEYFTFNRCSQLFLNWGAMVGPYINSPDLSYTGLGVNQFADNYTWNQEGCTLTNQSNNYFDDTRLAIIYNLTGQEVDDGSLSISQDNTYTRDGFRIKINNIPSNAASREIYIDGKHVSSIERDWSLERASSNNISENIFDDVWVYPYTEAGKKYKVTVKYIDKDYNTIETSRPKTVTANGGLGEFSVNTFTYSVSDDNKLVFSPAPAMKMGGSPIPSGTGYYKLETIKANNDWIENKEIGKSVSAVDLNNYFPRNKGLAKGSVFKFRLYYEIPGNSGVTYRFVILDYQDTEKANLKLAEDFPTYDTVVTILDSSSTYPGLNVQFDNTPSDAYSREIYLNDVKVSDLERRYEEVDRPNTHVGDAIWRYPYVSSGKNYKLRVKYIGVNWNTLFEKEVEFTGQNTGLGEISVTNKNSVAYKVENNELVFTTIPQITVGDFNGYSDNVSIYLKLTIVKASNDQWMCDEYIYGGDWGIDLSKIGNDKRPVSTSEKLYFELVLHISDLSKGYDCRYEIISKNDVKNKGGIFLTEDL